MEKLFTIENSGFILTKDSKTYKKNGFSAKFNPSGDKPYYFFSAEDATKEANSFNDVPECVANLGFLYVVAQL